MGKIEVKAGDRYGRLVVVGEVEPVISPEGKSLRRVLCQCDCGKTAIVRIVNALHHRLDILKWPIDRALTEPVRARRAVQ